MAKQGYYIISDDQYALLNALGGYTITDIDGYHCVTDWYSIYDAVIAAYDATYLDDDPENDAPQENYDIMEAAVQFMYYSTEAHTWFPA